MTKFWTKSPDHDHEQIDQELEQSLKDFKSSVHAWSDAVYSQPHRPVKIYRTSWRVASAWALGCALAVGSLAGGVYEHHHRQQLAKMAAAAAAQQKLAAARRSQKETEDLFAKVDSDISREVPSAMEPLAQLMAEDDSQ